MNQLRRIDAKIEIDTLLDEKKVVASNEDDPTPVKLEQVAICTVSEDTFDDDDKVVGHFLTVSQSETSQVIKLKGNRVFGCWLLPCLDLPASQRAAAAAAGLFVYSDCCVVRVTCARHSWLH